MVPLVWATSGVCQLRKQAAWLEEPVALGHGRTSEGAEVDLVAQTPESHHDRLGIRVVTAEDADVDVPCEARLGASRDGKPSDEGPSQLQRLAVPSKLVQRLLDGSCHTFTDASAKGTGLPGQSPNSAPGRSRRHSSMASSIWGSVYSGCSRRSRARIICSPRSERSRATRRRSAGVPMDMRSV